MARDRRNINEIERDIAAERDALRRDLERLVNKFTFEDVWRRIGRRIDTEPTVLAEMVKRLVREKPFAVGLTGFGLAWLMCGPKQNDLAQEHRDMHAPARSQARPAYLQDTADTVRTSAAVHGGEAHGDTTKSRESAPTKTRESAPPGGGTSQASPGTASGEGWTVSTDENARPAGDGPGHGAGSATTGPQKARSQPQAAAASRGGASRT